jgi:hypothetical protein
MTDNKLNNLLIIKKKPIVSRKKIETIANSNKPITSLGLLSDKNLDKLLDSLGKFYNLSISSLYFYCYNLFSPNLHHNTRFNNKYQLIHLYKFIERTFEHGNIYFCLIKKNNNYLKRKVFFKELPIIDYETYLEYVSDYDEIDSKFPNFYGQKFNKCLYSYNNPAYIDILCHYLCSRLVENGLSVHFPLFYGCINTVFRKYTQVFHEKTDYQNFINNNGSQRYNKYYKIINKDDKDKVEMYNLPVLLMATEVMDYDLGDFIEKSNTLFENTLLDEFDKSQYELHIQSILFQTIASLTLVQRFWNMNHNDLHLGNIMFKETKEKFINYSYKTNFYRIPTYGTYVKIIDWNRATLTYNGTNINNYTYLPEHECGEMYYYENSYNVFKKIVKPNSSFDLALLAYELLDSNIILDKKSKIYKLLMEWTMTDKDGNVFTNLAGDGDAGFVIYDTIAKKCHKAHPETNLQKSVWNNFKVSKSDIPENEKIYNLN